MTAADQYNYRLDKEYEKVGNARIRGTRFVLNCLFGSPPFVDSKKNDSDEKETNLLHKDLNHRNIFVSDDGEVTGILDWDHVSTVPRCVGFPAVPIWLREDWQREYEVLVMNLYSPWRLEKYRKIYAEALMEACSGPGSDAKFT